MPVLDQIEWLKENGREILGHFSERGSLEIRLGSRLTVADSQAAVFVKDGKALDVLSTGQHTLTTRNLPNLSRMFGLAYEDRKAAFKADLYFVDLGVFSDQKWSAREPLKIMDSELGLVSVRASGSYSMRVSDPMVFVNAVSSRKGRKSNLDIGNLLRDVILDRMTDLMTDNLKSIFDLPEMYDELSVAAKILMRDDYSRLGLELIDFFLSAVNPSEEIQRLIDQRSHVGTPDSHRSGATQKEPAEREKMWMEGLTGGFSGTMTKSPVDEFGANVAPISSNAGSVCPDCRRPVFANDKFCLHCGSAIVRQPVCTKCGFTMTAEMKFCPQCGLKALSLNEEKARVQKSR